MAIQDDGGKLYLTGEPLEAFVTAADVRAHVIEIHSIMAEASGNDAESGLGFVIGTIDQRIESGVWRSNHSIELSATIHTVSILSGTLGTRIDGLSEAERKSLEDQQREREYQQRLRKATAWTVSALRSPNAREVQRILNRELTPLTIGHIVELIEAEPGVFKALGVSRNQLGRLTGSINNRKVYGGSARHMKPHEPPPNPIHLDEAKVFIRDVADRWFERIAGI